MIKRKIITISENYNVGSIGYINFKLGEYLSDRFDVVNAYSNNAKHDRTSFKYSNLFLQKISALFSRIFGNYGFNAFFPTVKLISIIKRNKPCMVILHNLHAHNCNLSMLLNYLTRKNIKVIWVYHDCWAFTGYCTHFESVKCNNWTTGCNSCPLKKQFSWFFDRSRTIQKRKISLINKLKPTIVCPSDWMCENVKRSLIKDCQVVNINNGINLSIFNNKGKLFELSKKTDKKIILAIAAYFHINKGLLDLLELSKMLKTNEIILLVGSVNSKLLKKIPKNIIYLGPIYDKNVLASIYRRADVFVNPTYEDTYPTVNIESVCCGTPVVCYNSGGCKETINSLTGILCDKGNVKQLYSSIQKAYKLKGNKDFDIQRKKFDEHIFLEKYKQLINKVIEEEK